MIVIQKVQKLRRVGRKPDVGEWKYKHPTLGNARESLAKWWREYEPEI